MGPKANALGDYLRARREQIRPEDVGLVAGERRRVAGLRREELALLAGISFEYYLQSGTTGTAVWTNPAVEDDHDHGHHGHAHTSAGPDWSETIAFGTVQVLSSPTSLPASAVIHRVLGA